MCKYQDGGCVIILKQNMETKVGKTADNELLIHREDGNGGYFNLIIDKDGGIEIMHIKSDRSKSWNKVDVSLDEAIDFWNFENL